MRSLGVRPINGGAHWVLTEGTRSAPAVVKSGRITKPKSYDDYQALNHLREKLRSVIRDEQVDEVSVRDNDYPKATKKFYPRVRAEAIALEVAAAERKPVALVPWAKIASALGIAKEKDKKKGYMAAAAFRGIDCSAFGTEERDALHAAVAGLPK